MSVPYCFRRIIPTYSQVIAAVLQRTLRGKATLQLQDSMRFPSVCLSVFNSTALGFPPADKRQCIAISLIRLCCWRYDNPCAPAKLEGRWASRLLCRSASLWRMSFGFWQKALPCQRPWLYPRLSTARKSSSRHLLSSSVRSSWPHLALSASERKEIQCVFAWSLGG